MPLHGDDRAIGKLLDHKVKLLRRGQSREEHADQLEDHGQKQADEHGMDDGVAQEGAHDFAASVSWLYRDFQPAAALARLNRAYRPSRCFSEMEITARTRFSMSASSGDGSSRWIWSHSMRRAMSHRCCSTSNRSPRSWRVSSTMSTQWIAMSLMAEPPSGRKEACRARRHDFRPMHAPCWHGRPRLPRVTHRGCWCMLLCDGSGRSGSCGGRSRPRQVHAGPRG